MRTTAMAGLAAMAVIGAAAARAAEHEVQMLNRGEEGMMVFEPAFLQIAPGDTVRFVPTNPGHNAETVRGMIPDDAEPFKGRVGQEIAVTFDVEGAYGYMCLPHVAMGMVGLIVVGEDPANLDEAEAARVPPKARERFDGYFAQARQ